MGRKIIAKPRIIISSIVVIIFISVTAVIAYRYFRAPSKPVIHEDIVQQVPESAVEDKSAPELADYYSNVDLFESKNPSRVYIDNTAFKRHDTKNEQYVFSSNYRHDEYNSFKNDRDSNVQISRKLRTIREDNSTIPSSISKNKAVSFTRTAVTSNSTNSIPEINSPESPPGNNSPAPDEDNQEDNNVSSYDVSISRSLTSGSFDEDGIDVVLSIYIGIQAPNGLIVKEYIPEGWDVIESSIPAYGKFDPSSGEIKWLFIGTDIGSMEITYKIVKKETFASGASLRGIFLYNNPGGEHLTMQIEGENKV